MRSPSSRFSIFREQWLLLALIALLALVWIGQVFGPASWAERFMVVPSEVVQSWGDLRSGTFDTDDIARFGTLLGYAFLHGGLDHLAFNALYLWVFAALIVRHLGQGWFVAIYALTAVAGGVAHVMLEPGSAIPMLGASGAVMGFEGAYLGLAVRYRLADPQIWPMAHPIPPAQLAALGVIGVAIDFHDVFAGAETFTAHGAHIGGFVMGLLITSFVRADEEPR